MTSRDCVKAAIEHRSADRVPFSISLCGETMDALKEAIGENAAEQLVDSDVASVGPPWWGWHDLGADWQEMAAPASPPRVIGSGDHQKFAANVKAARDTGKYVLVGIYGSHFEKAYFSRGFENFLADMAAEPAFARKLLSTIIEKNMVMLDNFLALPEIDGVMLGSDWGSQLDLLMSPAVWEEMIRPGEQREYDLIHSYGKDVWVHSCGNIVKALPSLVEMGLDVLNPVQPEAMDIAMLKREFGEHLTFWGGISTQQTLPYGTPDEVRAEARRVRDMMSECGGYIFSPSQAVQDDVPLENILALFEVARETGGGKYSAGSSACK